MRKSSILIQLLFAFFLALLAGCSQGSRLPRIAADGVVLAFGDSITAGSGAGAGESYPEILGGLIGRRVVNAGIPGEVTAEGAARLPELLDSVKPALLILCHGGNDLLRHMDQRQAADNLRGMIRMARERGVAVVLVAVPSPDLSLKPPAFYGELAAESGLPIESKVLGKILGKGSLKSDYIHPNAAGYRQLAEALAALLKKSGAI
ncbi:MAG: GDSL-type esterase/lipase family protein [Pseudomonadota bacterium]